MINNVRCCVLWCGEFINGLLGTQLSTSYDANALHCQLIVVSKLSSSVFSFVQNEINAVGTAINIGMETSDGQCCSKVVNIKPAMYFTKPLLLKN